MARTLYLWTERGASRHCKILDGVLRDFKGYQRNVPKKFANRDKAREWIILNQFGRRNLTAFQRAELALQLKPGIIAEAREKEFERKTTLTKSAKSNMPQINTREKLAKVAGISQDTLRKAKVIKKEGALVMPLSATKKPPPVRAAAWITWLFSVP